MDSPEESYHRKKKELAEIIDKWWTSEDLFTEFDELLFELKILAKGCSASTDDRIELELLEIEEHLRNECLID